MTDATKLSASSLRLRRFSFRFAEQVLNSKLSLKEEIEQVLLGAISDITKLSRPAFNELLEDRFVAKGWQASRPCSTIRAIRAQRWITSKRELVSRSDLVTPLLLASTCLNFKSHLNSALDKIDVGGYVVTTSRFQKFMKSECGQNWEGSLTSEKVKRYLPHFKSAIQVPISVLGIDV